MIRRPARFAAAAVLVTAAFAAGLLCAPGGGLLSGRSGSALSWSPQGRGTRAPTPSEPLSKELPTASEPAPLVYEADGGQAGAGNGFIAVTGSYGVGTS